MFHEKFLLLQFYYYHCCAASALLGWNNTLCAQSRDWPGPRRPTTSSPTRQTLTPTGPVTSPLGPRRKGWFATLAPSWTRPSNWPAPASTLACYPKCKASATPWPWLNTTMQSPAQRSNTWPRTITLGRLFLGVFWLCSTKKVSKNWIQAFLLSFDPKKKLSSLKNFIEFPTFDWVLLRNLLLISLEFDAGTWSGKFSLHSATLLELTSIFQCFLSLFYIVL